MTPVRHHTCNAVLGAPKETGELEVTPLDICRTKFQGVQSTVSFWTPSEEEIANILAGHPISVHVMGPAIYPVYIGVTETP